MTADTTQPAAVAPSAIRERVFVTWRDVQDIMDAHNGQECAECAAGEGCDTAWLYQYIHQIEQRATASEAALVAAERGQETIVAYGDIVAIGEPGAYVCAGHLGIAGVTRMIEYLLSGWDETFDSLDDPYHGWLLVRLADDDEDVSFTEVVAGTPDAQPYTIVGCTGYWNRLAPTPSGGEQPE